MAGQSLLAICQHLGVPLPTSLTTDAAADLIIERIAPLTSAQAGEMSFLSDKKYLAELASTSASVVLVNEHHVAACPVPALVVANPYVAMAKVAQLLDPSPLPQATIHPSAIIDESASIGANVHIGARAVIGPNVSIGAGAIIEAGTVLGDGVQIGAYTRLHANVTVYHHVQLGEHCAVHSGTVIGCDGFGYANDRGQWIKIPQIGTVIIGDCTEIGANTCIDRGALENTEIGNHIIIDNDVHIAHNIKIGDGSCICGAVGMAGSTTIGKNVVIAGTVAINGHISICDNVQITGNTMVTSDITEPGVYSSGMPHMPNAEWRRLSIRLKQLEDLFKRVKSLEKTRA